jgi:HPr kinase/phosphorylase
VRDISLAQLFEDNREKLLLNWVIGDPAEHRIEIKDSNNFGADVVGHINIIHPERLQVMGQAEYEWALSIGERRFNQVFQDLLAAQPPAIIAA